MSWRTSTWPSQPGPAPMPMVGIGNSAGDPGGQLGGDAFERRRRRPRPRPRPGRRPAGRPRRAGPCRTPAGGSTAASARRGPSRESRPRPAALIVAAILPAPLELHRLTVRLLEDPSRRADRLPSRHLVARGTAGRPRPGPGARRGRPSRRGRSPGRASRRGSCPGRGPWFPSSRPPAGNRPRPRRAAGPSGSRRRSERRSFAPGPFQAAKSGMVTGRSSLGMPWVSEG